MVMAPGKKNSEKYFGWAYNIKIKEIDFHNCLHIWIQKTRVISPTFCQESTKKWFLKTIREDRESTIFLGLMVVVNRVKIIEGKVP